MTTQVVGQVTPQESAVAGAGAGAPNPWAEYGLNPDGTPITAKVDPNAKPVDPEKAALQAKIANLEAKIAKIPEGFEGLSEKIKLVDKLVTAIRGDEPKAPAGFPEIWSDLKEVAKTQAPGVAKLLDMLESDPTYLERLETANQALMAQHVIGINEKAHARVMELAKKAGFKGSSDGELNDMVFPFEQSMTMLINANPEMRKAFLSGNIGLVDEIFNRMIKPHVAQRLREKTGRTTPSAFPKAPPKSGAQPAAANEEPKKPDIHTPKGRAAFHQQAVARWLDKASSKGDE